VTANSARGAAQRRDLIFRSCGLIGNAHELAEGTLKLPAVIALAERDLREVLSPAQLLAYLAVVAADLVQSIADLREVPFDDPRSVRLLLGGSRATCGRPALVS